MTLNPGVSIKVGTKFEFDGEVFCVRKFEDESYTRIYLYERENCVPDIMEVNNTFDEVVSLLDAGKFTYTPPVPAKLELNF